MCAWVALPARADSANSRIDKFPVSSWILLRGKCRNDTHRFHQYPDHRVVPDCFLSA